MSSNSSSAVSGIAYQSIIIALIAGGILTIGVVSILWRRRSQRSWMAMRADAHLPLGMGMGFGTGMGDETGNGPGGRRRGKKLGKAPEVWDVLIGTREKQKERDGEKEELEGTAKGDLEDQVGESWSPTSIALHEISLPVPEISPEHLKLPPPPTAPPTYAAEMTVLIAMPSPDRPITFHPRPSTSSSHHAYRSATGHGPAQNSTTETIYDYSAAYTYTHPSLPPHIDAEDESLPDLIIGSTCVPLSASTGDASTSEVGRWIDEAEAARIAASSSSSRRTHHTHRGLINVTPPTQTRYPASGAAASQASGEEQYGWAGRLGMAGVIRRGDMIARPRTPEAERSRWDRRGGDRETQLDGQARGEAEMAADPRARPNLFRLANMSHSMGVFRFGNMAGLPSTGASGSGREVDRGVRQAERSRSRSDRGTHGGAAGFGSAIHRQQHQF